MTNQEALLLAILMLEREATRLNRSLHRIYPILPGKNPSRGHLRVEEELRLTCEAVATLRQLHFAAVQEVK